MSGFSFGTPATTTTQTGFNFGAPKTTAIATTTPMLNFGGTPAANTGAGLSFGAQPTFGATAAPAFGAPSAAAPAFGAPAAAPAFGATAAAPAFGTAATTPAFGATATTPAFGATAASAAPAFGASAGTTAPTFGVPAASTAPTFSNTGAFGFGTQVAAAAASAAPTAPTLSFGAAAAQTAQPSAAVSTIGTAPAPTLGLGGGGFSFGKPAATTSASLNFGTTTTAATPFAAGTGGGLFGKATTAATPATSTTPFVGLGGIDVSATQPKAGDSKQDNIKVKETQVPDEIAKTVDALKTFIKAQKTLSSDIGRTSTSKLSNVSGEIINLQWSLQEIANSVEANHNQIKMLRKETSKTMQSVEMAQRTQDTPAGLQYENNAPFQYFQNLVSKYEQDLISFREQISLTEQHMRSLANPQNISPEDMKRAFLQINESFISLAGRLHEIHQKVEAQKEQYLNLRKYRLRDTTNVFAKIDNPEVKVDSSRITAGPTPFSNISAMSSFGKSFGSAAATSSGTTTAQSAK